MHFKMVLRSVINSTYRMTPSVSAGDVIELEDLICWLLRAYVEVQYEDWTVLPFTAPNALYVPDDVEHIYTPLSGDSSHVGSLDTEYIRRTLGWSVQERLVMQEIFHVFSLLGPGVSEVTSSKLRFVAQLFLNSHQLVVLCQSF